MKFAIMTTALPFVFLISVMAQEESNTTKPSNWAIIANIGHQDDLIVPIAGSVPVIHKVNVRPKVEIGLEYTWMKKKNTRFFQDAKINFHQHTYVERSLGIGTDLCYEVRLFNTFCITPRVGLYYNAAKQTDVQYKFNGSVWERIKNTKPFISRGYVKLGLDLSYGLNSKLDIVGGAYIAILKPYIKDVIPTYFYKGINLGIRYKL